jgi:hypothetical protein
MPDLINKLTSRIPAPTNLGNIPAGTISENPASFESFVLPRTKQPLERSRLYNVEGLKWRHVTWRTECPEKQPVQRAMRPEPITLSRSFRLNLAGCDPKQALVQEMARAICKYHVLRGMGEIKMWPVLFERLPTKINPFLSTDSAL